ncbi:hypothetical protein GALMADRAFT_146770 [Galerina marginata CBS 339.88]|uniref:Uncharacterized protein n=1 Tax=Galerina marginata (strain CBS 339.88) TaxID=685588 RepID=A0A067SDH2_GALM3|nr:hypothetical protein GALMADRAFT_146770 [Galerina marginata CBS 339.88]
MSPLTTPEIRRLGLVLRAMLPRDTPYYKCALICNDADDIELVDVPLLAGRGHSAATDKSHRNLDIFLWLPVLRTENDSAVDIDNNRYTFKHASSPRNWVQYTFMFYNQDNAEKIEEWGSNRLLAAIVGESALPWFGPMLVTKGKGRRLCNVKQTEIEVIKTILRTILTDGTLA